ncbi:MAG: hypothetical protein JXR65_02530 [Bacteroidales bacterium]|nr:hypothetical protein [Bacteroidales bacterium]
MKILIRFILTFLFLTTVYSLKAQNDFYKYSNDLENLYSHFGGQGTRPLSFTIRKATDYNDALFFKNKYIKDRVRANGRTYYNVTYEQYVMFKDISYVYERGSKIYLVFKNNRKWKIRSKERGYWSKFYYHSNDYYITIYNDNARQRALKAFKYFIKHPYSD